MPDTPTFAAAAVAAPHALAAETGRAILGEGGNAIEAMVAMAATIAVVYPHMNGLGGDGVWLVREPRGRVRAIEAIGPAGQRATLSRYRDLGHDAIPFRGVGAALTVAGAVGGWALSLELAAGLGGRLPREILLSEAIRHAREGYPVSHSEARTIPIELDALRDAPGFADAFLIEGRPPAAGTPRRAPALAATLQQLAHAGFDDFYRGDVGRELAADLDRLGCPVTREDLRTYRAASRAPLSLRIEGALLHNTPPPTQGLASLLLLGIVDRLGLPPQEGPAYVHGLTEAAKRALALRDRVVTDPARPSELLTPNPETWLEPRRIAREAAAIDPRRAAVFPTGPADGGDTVWMGAIDRTGLAVSYIQSIYWEYGSGVVLPGTGVHWQNRGIAFSLDPGALNALAPGLRPPHTLNPALAEFADGRVAAYGSMGGDGQPQFQAQVLTRYARHGMGVAAAIDAPRFLFGRTWGAGSVTLKVEDRLDADVVAALGRLGHEVETLGGAHIDALGHAGMLVRHPRDGRVEAAHDPRSDGGAAGI